MRTSNPTRPLRIQLLCQSCHGKQGFLFSTRISVRHSRTLFVCRTCVVLWWNICLCRSARCLVSEVTVSQKMASKLAFDGKDKDRRKYFIVKTICCAAFMLLIRGVDANTSMAYREVEKLGNSCPRLDSCAFQTTAHRGQRAATKDRNCKCDSLCPEYGDCCIDAPWRSNNSRIDSSCLQLEQTGGVYAIDTCPPSYRGPEEVRSLCEKAKDQTDPLGSMPVTDPSTGATYKNYYCHICDGDSDGFLMWTPKLECPLLRLMNSSKAITSEYVLQNLESDGRGWGLYLTDESDGSRFFHDCSVQPVLPPPLEGKVRTCTPRLISDCPPTWTDPDVRHACRSYAGARFDPDGRAYRNVHCALCNGKDAARLSCQSGEEIDLFRESGTHSFALLLDISERRGGKARACGRGEVYDPFFRKCRTVTCLPGMVRRGRRCVVRNPVQSAKFVAGLKRSVRSSTAPVHREVDRNATHRPEEFSLTPETFNSTLKQV